MSATKRQIHLLRKERRQIEPSFVACLALGVSLLATMVCAHTVYAEGPQVHDGASAPAAAWRTAMEHGDLAALAEMHDAATTAYPPGSTQVKGAAAIMAGYADLFAHYSVNVTIEDAHWVEVPPLVVSWGLTTLTLHPKAGGADIVSHTRFTDAAIAAGGHWRYLVDHASKPAGK